MAFYEHFLREVPQLPVSCFSKRPESIVMWSHYGRDCTGICLGFDEDELADTFPIAYIDNVSYADGPAQISSHLVQHAFATGKQRHTLRMMDVAHRAVYFVKRRDWEYECERRVVVDDRAVTLCDGHLIARVPQTALRYCILGAKIDAAMREFCKSRFLPIGVGVLEQRIQKRRYAPLFSQGEAQLRWTSGTFEVIAGTCLTCGAAETESEGICRWCNISDDARHTAGTRSMLSAMLQYGVVDATPIHFDGLSPKGHLSKAETPESHAVSQTPLEDFEF